MKKITTISTLFVVALLVTTLPLLAQDASPVPKPDVRESLKQESEKTQQAPESKSESSEDSPLGKAQEPSQEKSDKKSDQQDSKQKSADDKQADDKQADDKQADDKQADDKQADDEKADDKQADDKQADDKQADDKQADDKQADDKQADDKQADDKQADDKQADDKQADDKQADDKQADDKQADDKQADDKKADESEKNKQTGSRTIPFNPWSRDRERVATYSKKSGDFVGVFESVVASANASTLEVVSGKRQIALGTVVDSNGYVLTKASELRGDIGCKLLDGTIAKAKVIGIDSETDLALLKVDAENLNVIQWSLDPPPQTGQWVASPKADRELPTIGVVSVDAREIPPSKPFIGITMTNVPDGDGVKILSVVPKSPADTSNLWVNDVILKIDTTEISDIDALRKTLEQYDIADRVTLSVKRGKKDLKIKLTLAKRDEVSPENSRSNQQNSMGSILSRRRKDFPRSFQHDSMLNSKTCGGPIVDLSGKVVGINIARAGRVSSLALTAATVQPVIERLKSGQLAPALVNKVKIEELDAELKEIDVKLGKLPENKTDLERKYNVEKARMEEIEKSMEDLKNRMKVIEEKATDYKSDLDAAVKELRAIERLRRKLETDRKQLATGSR